MMKMTSERSITRKKKLSNHYSYEFRFHQYSEGLHLRKQIITMNEIIDDIFSLYTLHGDEDYIGEPVSQLEHMLQAGELARLSAADEEEIMAAFFHDIGHLLEAEGVTVSMDRFGVASHERIGADYIRSKGFSEKMAVLVGSHVEAKRYLTFRRPGYYEKLSPASRHTLELQGGKMSEQEAAEFEKDSLFECKVRMRLWDDAAKEKVRTNAELSYFRVLAEKLLLKN
jgi:phosphonate degradation associated HDIG domain protein